MRSGVSSPRKRRKAIVYVRVSSQEQTENFSLENQETQCRRFAGIQGLEVIRVFRNDHGESAKTIQRKALQEVMSFAADPGNEVGAIIVYKRDRLSRNMGDFVNLHNAFEGMGIRVLSATEMNGDDAYAKMARNVSGVFAQFDNDVKSERTIDGMKAAARSGRWTWRAPFGYMFDVDESGRKRLYLDDNAQYVRAAYELAATGMYSQTEIVRRLRALGCEKIYKQKLSQILHNPVYAGWIYKPEWFSEMIKGVHEPVVDMNTWERTQLVLQGKKPNFAPKRRNNPEFPLRNFLTCRYCGSPITGSFSTSRNKTKHPYYHCRGCRCDFGSARREAVHADFEDLLSQLAVPTRVWKLFRVAVADVWRDAVGQRVEDERQLRRRLTELTEERTKITRLLARGTLQQSDYVAAREQIDTEIMEVRSALEALSESDDFEKCLAESEALLLDPASFWRSASLDVRQRFQSVVFPRGLPYANSMFGTAPISLVFSELGCKKVGKSRKAPLTQRATWPL